MAEHEVWKPIPGYKQYEASNFGNIRSVDRWVRFGKTDKLRFCKGQVIKKCPSVPGYERVSLGRKTGYLVHQLILLAFAGPCPSRMEVRHIDGNKLNNRLDNLKYGTRVENQEDMAKHGTSNKGRCLIICNICGAKRRP